MRVLGVGLAMLISLGVIGVLLLGFSNLDTFAQDSQTTEPVEEPVQETTPPVEEPVQETTPPVEEPVQETTPPVEEPVQETTPPVEEPVQETTPPVEEPVQETTPPVEEPVQETEPVIEKSTESTVVQQVEPLTKEKETKVVIENPVNENIQENSAEQNSKKLESTEKRVMIVYKQAMKNYHMDDLKQKKFKIKKQLDILPAVIGKVDKNMIAQIKASKDVAYVIEAKPVHKTLKDSVPQIKGDLARTAGFTGSGVNVCIVDTGIDYNAHPTLTPVAQNDFANSDSIALDDDGHGTHVAGAVASTAHPWRGVAEGVSLMAAKVLDENGSGFSTDVVLGINWCVTNGADVINLSLSGSQLFSGTCDSEATAMAGNAAVSSGVTVFAASGNDGQLSRLPAPACGSDVIAVGAVDKNDLRQIYPNEGSELDFVAPGTDITSTFLAMPFLTDEEDMDELTGTSMASPHAAAVGALLLEQDPSRTPAQVRSIMQQSADDLTQAHCNNLTPCSASPGRDNVFGWGRINAFAALGLSSTDTDLDGIPDVSDNCPGNSNSNQLDVDEDGIGDICDANLCGQSYSFWNPIIGDETDEVIVGTSGADFIAALGGNDHVVSGDGNDCVYLGWGNDFAFGGAGLDEIHGGQGPDSIWGGPGDDNLFGDRGKDNIRAGPGSDNVSGGESDDELVADAGTNTIDGENGDDTCDGNNVANQNFNSCETILNQVVDNTSPVITIVGNNPETQTFGNTYTDAGATALDDVDGDVTGSITTTNNVDPNVLGPHTVDYSVTDAAGNTAMASRTVNVVDITDPILTIVGNNPETQTFGNTYTDAGATALDDVDGDVTGSITTTNNVDPNVLGPHTVDYSVTDAAGNTAMASRTVNVVDTTPPEVTAPSDISEETTTGAGIIVNYPAPTATDDVGVTSGPSCIPSSGSIFSIGVTNVNCTAEDAAANVGSDSFTITVEEELYCNGMTIPDLISSGTYNVIDNRGGPSLTLTGTNNDDLILAGDNGDQIFSKQGNDCVIGGIGNDFVNGGPHEDIIFGRSGDDDLTGDADNDTIYGGDGDDIINGKSGDDTIYGENGSDILYGFEGNDYLQGDSGNDSILGFQGSDTLYGNSGNDYLNGGSGDDFIYGGQDDDVMYGTTGIDTMQGNDGDDIIYGGEDGDMLYGDSGDDYIEAQPGQDNIFGGPGNDMLLGNEQIDTVDGGIDFDKCIDFLGLDTLINCES